MQPSHVTFYMCDICSFLVKDLVTFIIHKQEHKEPYEDEEYHSTTTTLQTGILPLKAIPVDTTGSPPIFIPKIHITPLELLYQGFETQIPILPVTKSCQSNSGHPHVRDVPLVVSENRIEDTRKSRVDPAKEPSLIESRSEELSNSQLSSNGKTPIAQSSSGYSRCPSSHNATKTIPMRKGAEMLCKFCPFKSDFGNRAFDRGHMANEHSHIHDHSYSAFANCLSKLDKEGYHNSAQVKIRCKYCPMTFARKEWLQEHVQNSCYNKLLMDRERMKINLMEGNPDCVGRDSCSDSAATAVVAQSRICNGNTCKSQLLYSQELSSMFSC